MNECVGRKEKVMNRQVRIPQTSNKTTLLSRGPFRMIMTLLDVESEEFHGFESCFFSQLEKWESAKGGCLNVAVCLFVNDLCSAAS